MGNRQTYISFIIPCYKVEKYLAECIESIQRQQVDSWEAIIIDDGSPDRSGIIADEYAAKDDRIVVVHQTNQGVSVARNAGLDKASGKWVWFIDSDDYIAEGALAKLDSVIQMNDCDTVFFGLRHRYNNYEQNSPVKSLIGIRKDMFLEQIYCYTNPAMVFSNDIIQRFHIRFTTGVKMAEDLEFQYKYLFFCKKPISISDCLYIYQHREDSATTNPDTYRNNMNDCMKVARNLLSFIENFSTSELMWFSKRVRTLLKSGLQAAEHLTAKERNHLQEELRGVIDVFVKNGYKGVKDRTLSLAYWNLNIYFFCLRLFYKLKGLQQ